jgi:hypothetical protein
LTRSRRPRRTTLGRHYLKKRVEHILRAGRQEHITLDVARTVEGKQSPSSTLLPNYTLTLQTSCRQPSLGNSIVLVLGFRLRMYLVDWLVLRERPPPSYLLSSVKKVFICSSQRFLTFNSRVGMKKIERTITSPQV